MRFNGRLVVTGSHEAHDGSHEAQDGSHEAHDALRSKLIFMCVEHRYGTVVYLFMSRGYKKSIYCT
jgi:hypothetical protein